MAFSKSSSESALPTVTIEYLCTPLSKWYLASSNIFLSGTKSVFSIHELLCADWAQNLQSSLQWPVLPLIIEQSDALLSQKCSLKVLAPSHNVSVSKS